MTQYIDYVTGLKGHIMQEVDYNSNSFSEFCKAIAQNGSATKAYKANFNTEGMTNQAIRQKAHRLKNDEQCKRLILEYELDQLFISGATLKDKSVKIMNEHEEQSKLNQSLMTIFDNAIKEEDHRLAIDAHKAITAGRRAALNALEIHNNMELKFHDLNLQKQQQAEALNTDTRISSYNSIIDGEGAEIAMERVNPSDGKSYFYVKINDDEMDIMKARQIIEDRKSFYIPLVDSKGEIVAIHKNDGHGNIELYKKSTIEEIGQDDQYT